jgi:hypothetical protein
MTCKAPDVSRGISSTRYPGFAVYFAMEFEKITAPSVAPSGWAGMFGSDDMQNHIRADMGDE